MRDTHRVNQVSCFVHTPEHIVSFLNEHSALPVCRGQCAELKAGSAALGRSPFEGAPLPSVSNKDKDSEYWLPFSKGLMGLVLRATSVPLLGTVGSLEQKRPMAEMETSQLSQDKSLSAKLPLLGMWLQ